MRLSRVLRFSLLVVLIMAASSVAWASPFSANPADRPGPFNGGLQSYTILSPGTGPGTLTFDLLGYLSVDGANCCTDTFSLTINGNLMFQGGFDMGGGGGTFVNFIAPGVAFTSTSFGFFGGGLTQFSVPHTLLQGNNIYDFDYGSMQGLGDEGWGLQNVRINGNVTSRNVPEPVSVSLLALGLGGIGLVSRKRR